MHAALHPSTEGTPTFLCWLGCCPGCLRCCCRCRRGGACPWWRLGRAGAAWAALGCCHRAPGGWAPTAAGHSAAWARASPGLVSLSAYLHLNCSGRVRLAKDGRSCKIFQIQGASLPTGAPVLRRAAEGFVTSTNTLETIRGRHARSNLATRGLELTGFSLRFSWTRPAPPALVSHENYMLASPARVFTTKDSASVSSTLG